MMMTEEFVADVEWYKNEIEFKKDFIERRKTEKGYGWKTDIKRAKRIIKIFEDKIAEMTR